MIELLLITRVSERIAEIHQLLLGSNLVLEQLAQRSDSLWSVHRKSNKDAQSIFSFSESLHSDTKFTFDGELQSSEVYRRVSTANRRAREDGKVPDTFANGDLIDLGIDAKGVGQVDQPYLDELRRNMTTFALPSIPIINSPTADDDSTKRDTPASGDLHAGDGYQQDH